MTERTTEAKKWATGTLTHGLETTLKNEEQKSAASKKRATVVILHL